MELVAILRVLWRHRVLVGVAAVLAVLVGCSLVYSVGFPPESRRYVVGTGSATALVDTPSSQVIDLGGETPTDIKTLAARATLLASLLTSSPIKDEIAKRAGADPERLIAVPPPSDVGEAESGAPAALSDPNAIILKARVPTLESGEVPIIAVETQAPDPELATKLADEAVAALKDRLQSLAGLGRVPEAQRVVVTQLGPAKASSVTRGPTPPLGIVAALFVFGLGCAAIVGAVATVDGWRRATVMELFPEDDLFDYGEPSPAAGPVHEMPAPEHRNDSASRHTDAVGY